ncbi:lipoprotein [Escherichia coli]
MFKKILFPLVALFMLAGCAKPPTTIEVAPTITLPQQDPSLMGVTVSINGADQHTIRRWQKSPAIIKSLP